MRTMNGISKTPITNNISYKELEDRLMEYLNKNNYSIKNFLVPTKDLHKEFSVGKEKFRKVIKSLHGKYKIAFGYPMNNETREKIKHMDEKEIRTTLEHLPRFIGTNDGNEFLANSYWIHPVQYNGKTFWEVKEALIDIC